MSDTLATLGSNQARSDGRAEETTMTTNATPNTTDTTPVKARRAKKDSAVQAQEKAPNAPKAPKTQPKTVVETAPVTLPVALPEPPKVIIEAADKKGGVSTGRGIVDPIVIDKGYGLEQAAKNAEAQSNAFKGDIKTTVKPHIPHGIGSLLIPGSGDIAARVTQQANSYKVADPVKAKALLGPLYSRYVDEQAASTNITYALADGAAAKVLAALRQVYGDAEANQLVVATVPTTCAVRDIYAEDLAQGALAQLVGADKLAGLTEAIKVARTGPCTITYVAKK
jgi:hypothetical protein